MAIAERKVIPGGLYRHIDGLRYRVLNDQGLDATGYEKGFLVKTKVHYKQLDPGHYPAGQLWTRDIDDFLSTDSSGDNIFEQIRERVVFCDIDGTQNLAPLPIKTVRGLLRGKLNIPSSDQPLNPAQSRNRLLEMANGLLHEIRPFTSDSRVGLEMIKTLALSTNQEIRLAISSGRDPSLHEMTKRKIQSSGRSEYFEEDEIYLNNFNSSYGFKRSLGKVEIERGNSAVLFEDDLVAALMFSSLQTECHNGQRVLSYLVNNPFYTPRLLARVGIPQLPDNVILVNNFSSGAVDLAERVRDGLI